eukprot:354768_1
MTYIQLEKLNYQRLREIIMNFYPANDENVYCDFVFVGLLQTINNIMNKRIMDNLQKFMVRMRQRLKDKQQTDVRGTKMLIAILKLQKAKLPVDDKSEQFLRYVKTFDGVFAGIQKDIFDGHFSQYFTIPDFHKAIGNNLMLQIEAATDLVNGYMTNISHNETQNTNITQEIKTKVLQFYGDYDRKLLLPVVKIFLNKLKHYIMKKSTYPSRSTVFGVMAQMMKINKFDFYNNYVAIQCRKYITLQRIAKGWSENDVNPTHTYIDNHKRMKQLMDVFKLNEQQLDEYIIYALPEIKTFYTKVAKRAIQKALRKNQIIYIENQNNERCQYYFEKAIVKHQMDSVKKMGAKWYHGMNGYHEIKQDTPLSEDHIAAMVCYTDNSALCTLFRETYRRKHKDEKIETQKRRHSVFANMGKLLYEAFIFYASKDSQIQILYHGMSIPLVFSTTYCSFNAPTSTTTESSIATEFGNDTGIVIKFESSESSQYIRTLDMGLFSCFDRESEHLIFETRLHIKDIFIP